MATEATLFVVKMATSPMPYTANSTVFGYLRLVDAEHHIEVLLRGVRPEMEIWAVHSAQASPTGDKRVGMAPGASIAAVSLRKRYKANCHA